MEMTARTRDASPLSVSTISEDLAIVGSVTSKGALHLNGRVKGDIHCVALVVGANAQLDGDVVAEDVLVRGRLVGTIRALTVTLQAASHVEGSILHKSLSLESGTYFEGESCPSEDPLSSSEVRRPPMRNGAEAVSRGRVKGFVRSLPESLSA